MKRYKVEIILTALVAICVIVGVIGGLVRNVPSAADIRNPYEVFWMDSLVCTESVCTMSLRNALEERIEVSVSRETANFIGTSPE